MKHIIITNEDLASPFEFSGPPIDISKYTRLTVHSLYLEFSSRVGTCLIDVATTLTDQNVGNPDRIIATHFNESTSRSIYLTPTTPREYIIRGSWLNETYFKIIFGRLVGSLRISKLRLVITVDGC